MTRSGSTRMSCYVTGDVELLVQKAMDLLNVGPSDFTYAAVLAFADAVGRREKEVKDESNAKNNSSEPQEVSKGDTLIKATDTDI